MPQVTFLNLPQEGFVEALAEQLKQFTLFEGLAPEALLALAQKAKPCHFDKETAVFYEGDLPSEQGPKVFFVAKGCVKLVKYSTDGESTIVRLSTRGVFFGVTSALTNKPFPFSALALTETELLSIEVGAFEALVRQYPDLALHMLVALGEVLWFNYETHNQVVKRTDARVAKILLYHYQRDGATQTPKGLVLNIQLPHHYIASMTGIAYEESVRIISKLRKQTQCIDYLRGGKIVLNDLAKLKTLAQDDMPWGM